MSDIRYPHCVKCHENFPMEEKMLDGYEKSGDTFYCPKGHALVLPREDMVSQLRSIERLLRSSEDQVDRLYKQLECSRGVITRQRNRLIRGVCPYCAKNVKDICGHISERHDK